MTTATWAGWAEIDTLLRAAGTALSAPIKDVRRGIPFSATGRMIRYWYDGTGENPFDSETFGAPKDGLRVQIGVFLPMAGAGTPAADAALDSLLEECDRAIQAALLDDEYLGTLNGDSAKVGQSSASVEKIGEAVCRTLVIPVAYEHDAGSSA